jgi:UDP-N-acetylmuramoyl-tripeptide--D-alanyl-D-alanine ligase
MEAALIHFSNADEKNKIIIIGDMFELGKDSLQYHQKIINACKKIDFKKVFIVGEIFSKTNYPKEFISKQNVYELIEHLKSLSIKNSCVLVKGSRGIELEKTISHL